MRFTVCSGAAIPDFAALRPGYACSHLAAVTPAWREDAGEGIGRQQRDHDLQTMQRLAATAAAAAAFAVPAQREEAQDVGELAPGDGRRRSAGARPGRQHLVEQVIDGVEHLV